MESIGIQIFCFTLLLSEAWAQVNRAPQFLPGGDFNGFSVHESIPVGTSVYTLRAVDPEGSHVQYGIQGNIFNINPKTGVVTLASEVDRERKNLLEVVITVTDEQIFGQGPNTVTLKREIPVLDDNDNSPIFRNEPYTFSVSEAIPIGTTVFENIEITDADTGSNSDIHLICQNELSEQACEKFAVSLLRVGEGRYHGSIIVSQQLDFEESEYYILALQAEDNGVSGRRRSLTDVVIRLVDEQDQPPAFLSSPYFVSVAEGSPTGLSILSVKIEDGDRGSRRPLDISLFDPSNHFQILSISNDSVGIYTAVIGTSSSLLDCEDPALQSADSLYKFKIKATEITDDGSAGPKTETTVTIHVSDVDDHLPEFSRSNIHIQIPEDFQINSALPGVSLIVTDDDQADNAHFHLFIEAEGPIVGMFSVEPQDAVGITPVTIRLLNSDALDYENPNQRWISFQVIAKDSLGRQTSANVTVEVLDANDHSPHFDGQSYEISVAENAEPGTSIATISAVDEDSGIYGNISYSLIGFGSEKFVVTEDGTIEVGECFESVPCLDRELVPAYKLLLIARDGGKLSAEAGIRLEIIDVNDNAPEFLKSEYNAVVEIGSSVIKPPLFIKAVDKDKSGTPNSAVAYKISDTNDVNLGKKFSINATTGEITLKEAIRMKNSAQMVTSVTLYVTAEDQGVPALSSKIYVVIMFTGKDERRLMFAHSSYNISVPEMEKPGKVFLQVAAVDPSGSNAQIYYDILSGDLDNFVVNRTSGHISVSPDAVLDLDISPVDYSVVVQASAKPDRTLNLLSANTTVNIHIEDVNNKPPKFAQRRYVVHVSEDSPTGSVIVELNASDPDETSLLQYTLVEPITGRDAIGLPVSGDVVKQTFEIDEETGEVQLSGILDASAVSVYFLTARVMDLSAEMKLGNQSDIVEVAIYVDYSQSQGPRFQSPWTPASPFLSLDVPEEISPGTALFVLSASDPLSDKKIHYRLTEFESSNSSRFVSVDAITGVVRLRSALDYESLPIDKLVTFTVIAEVDAEVGDGWGGPRLSNATVTLRALDINDNKPEFAKEIYTAAVVEGSSLSEPVVVTRAIDKDHHLDYSTIEYSFHDSPDAAPFDIDVHTGAISVKRGITLDREAKNAYRLKVIAKDNPEAPSNQNTASALVDIDVLDVNDHAPTFVESIYQAVVPETAPAGHVIHKVRATDADTDNNAWLVYSIAPSSELADYIAVNETSGVVETAQSLSGKGRMEAYHVVIRASDHGSPPLATDVQLILHVTDVLSNDGQPSFVKPLPGEYISILENSPIGSLVTKVVVEDPDDPNLEGGRITYSLLDSQGPFTMNALTGEIRTTAILDREVKDRYQVAVLAMDDGTPTHQTAQLITIHVQDVDDHTPRFQRSKHSLPVFVEIDEEVPLGTVVTTIEALDEDDDDNANILYEIIAGNTDAAFSVNRTAPRISQLIVSGRLDREQHSSYLLTIRAVPTQHKIETVPFGERQSRGLDSVINEATGTKEGRKIQSLNPLNKHKTNSVDYIEYDPSDLTLMQLEIALRDIDDNPPVFAKEKASTGVPFNVSQGTEVHKFRATDADSTSDPVIYSIKDVSFHSLDHGENFSAPSVFAIDPLLGVLTTSQSLLYFETGYFVLIVEASSGSRSSQTLLTVFLLHGKALLKFIFNKPLSDVRQKLPTFQRELQNMFGSSMPLKVNIFDSHFSAREESSNRSSLCFQFLTGDNSALSIPEVEALLDLPNKPQLGVLYHNYDVKTVESCGVGVESYVISWAEVFIMAIAIAIALVALPVGMLVCHLHRRYKRSTRKLYLGRTLNKLHGVAGAQSYPTLERQQRIFAWQEARPAPIASYGASYA